jgi:hypothetical protein
MRATKLEPTVARHVPRRPSNATELDDRAAPRSA